MRRDKYRAILKSEQLLTFGWRDRLRLLWSGRLMVEHLFGCQYKPGRVESLPMKGTVLGRKGGPVTTAPASAPETGGAA